MQGLACAGFIPAGIGILAALYQPGRRKNRVFSAFSAAQPLGGGIGGMHPPFVIYADIKYCRSVNYLCIMEMGILPSRNIDGSLRRRRLVLCAE